jgi:hypothetical protein
MHSHSHQSLAQATKERVTPRTARAAAAAAAAGAQGGGTYPWRLCVRLCARIWGSLALS